jgi:mannitol/fructose-specific phosphotransferase system IIA component (Ntr-type)
MQAGPAQFAAKLCLVCGASLEVRPARLPGTAPCARCGAVLWFSACTADGQPEVVLPVVKLNLDPESSKEAVIARVAHELAALGLIRGELEGSVGAAILKRESQATTGIGKGIALPHAKHAGIERSFGAVVQLARSVPFDSIDGVPVHTLGVVLSPLDKPQEHMRFLGAVWRDLTGS